MIEQLHLQRCETCNKEECIITVIDAETKDNVTFDIKKPIESDLWARQIIRKMGCASYIPKIISPDRRKINIIPGKGDIYTSADCPDKVNKIFCKNKNQGGMHRCDEYIRIGICNERLRGFTQ